MRDDIELAKRLLMVADYHKAQALGVSWETHARMQTTCGDAAAELTRLRANDQAQHELIAKLGRELEAKDKLIEAIVAHVKAEATMGTEALPDVQAPKQRQFYRGRIAALSDAATKLRAMVEAAKL